MIRVPLRCAMLLSPKLLSAVLMSATLALFPARAQAELPPLSPDELEQRSTNIVTGRVTEMYTAVREKEPGWSDTLYAIEISVQDVKKGNAIQDGQTVIVRTWKLKQRPAGWAGPGGQYTIPKRGDTVTAYLNGKDGVLDALIPNGLRVQPAAKP